MKKKGRTKNTSSEELQIKRTSWKDNFLNRIYDFFSGDRMCSKCRYLKEEPYPLDKFIAIATRGSHPIRMRKICGLDGSVIGENEVRTKNCVRFKRRYGSAPAIREMRSFVRWSKRQWNLHSKIISLIVTVAITLIAILVTYLLAKGLL